MNKIRSCASQSRRSFLKTSVSAPALALAGGVFNIHVPKVLASAPALSLFSPPNEKIEKARAAALAILKPSQKELEHGFALHAASLVFDAYGFSPRCATDGDAMRAAMEAGATEQELHDLREELPMIHNVTSEREKKEYLDAFHSSGVTCIFQNAGQEGNDPLRLLKRLARFTHVTDHLREDVFKAVTPDDIVSAKKQNKHCLYLTTNGVPLRQQFENVRDEMGLIRVFVQLGIRMMHLTYNRRNMIGDGVGEKQDKGISNFGEMVIDMMNKLGVIVDVAHSGWRTSLEAAKASTCPVVASHTTAAALHQHVRGKPDKVIKAICDTGGLVGICCIPDFLGGEGHVGTFLNHIDHVAKTFGSEHVAIGSDIAYQSRFASAENAKIPKRTGKARPRAWEQLWPEGSLTGRRDASLAWSNWPLFTVGLVQRGYTDEAIQNIIGGNMLRLSRAVWESRAGSGESPC